MFFVEGGFFVDWQTVRPGSDVTVEEVDQGSFLKGTYQKHPPIRSINPSTNPFNKYSSANSGRAITETKNKPPCLLGSYYLQENPMAKDFQNKFHVDIELAGVCVALLRLQDGLQRVRGDKLLFNGHLLT